MSEPRTETLIEDLQQAERQRDELLRAAALLPGRVPFDEFMALVERIQSELGRADA